MRLPLACGVCRSLIGSNSGLCAKCSTRLFELRDPQTRADRGLAIRSLFSWRMDDLRAYSRLIASLKRQSTPERWRELASWFVAAHECRPKTLVPVPSKGPNHALGFALAISELTSWPVADVLLPPEDGQQKRLSREERRLRHFHASHCKEYNDVAVIDDIVTTGATALAAYHALGRPSNCEVWSLMDRRPCGSMGALL